jgi:flagellar protein FliO/FliZ
VLASLLVVVLAISSAATGVSIVPFARAVLLAAAAGGLVLWWRRARSGGAALKPMAPRLEIVQRAGLSPRCALALVTVDGAEFLIAYGDGFAQFERLARRSRKSFPEVAPTFGPPPVALARRPRPAPRRSPKGGAR